MIVRCNNGADAFVFSEVFENRCYEVPLPWTPSTILDAGANIGFATVYFARRFPAAKIACVEPMPDNLKLLRENIAGNDVTSTVFAAALSIVDGPVTMQAAEKDYSHKVAEINFGPPASGGTINVEGVTVASVMSKMNWKSIDLMKIDIEGYEAILLQQNCEWLSRVRAICIECHEGFGESNLRQIAHDNGFMPPRLLNGLWLLIRKDSNE